MFIIFQIQFLDNSPTVEVKVNTLAAQTYPGTYRFLIIKDFFNNCIVLAIFYAFSS